MESYNKCKVCSNETFQYLPTLKLVKCEKCGLIFFSERINNEDVESLYKDLYQNSPGYKQHKKQGLILEKGKQPPVGYNKKFVLKKILKNKDLNIGEIGAGVGVVAKYVMDLGYNYEGFEIHKAIAEIAAAEGLKIRPLGYEGLREFQNYFDAIVAFEVLEHIEDIDGCFRIMYKSLKNNGSIGFTVPNTEKYMNYEKIQTKLFQDNPPVHVNFFTIQSLKKILPLYGFEPRFLKVRKFPDMSMRSIYTYKSIVKMLFGKYYGSTILCVAQKKYDI